MMSELVTNAVRHTRTVLLVLVTIENHTLHVDVTDDDSTLPSPPDPEHDATNGRARWIVDALATRWGVIPTTQGKTVWFEVQLPWQGGDSARSAAPPLAASTGGRSAGSSPASPRARGTPRLPAVAPS
jgi:hypothetical protein